ncbi:MAG: hypothetical protein H6512_14380 [Acidimicrobiia bacterium]|nr:hypothetical protein [Acidimicrobiia bacterium]
MLGRGPRSFHMALTAAVVCLTLLGCGKRTGSSNTSPRDALPQQMQTTTSEIERTTVAVTYQLEPLEEALVATWYLIPSIDQSAHGLSSGPALEITVFDGYRRAGELHPVSEPSLMLLLREGTACGLQEAWQISVGEKVIRSLEGPASESVDLPACEPTDNSLAAISACLPTGCPYVLDADEISITPDDSPVVKFGRRATP